MSLHKKLAEIQQTLNAPKNLYNSFGKYNYRSAEGILEAVKPLLAENTLIITDEVVVLGEGEHARFYIKATATFSDGKDSIVATAVAREALNKKGMDDSQISGATSSYARKYALNGLLLIDDTKDADATNDHGKEPPKRNSKPVEKKEEKKEEPKDKPKRGFTRGKKKEEVKPDSKGTESKQEPKTDDEDW